MSDFIPDNPYLLLTPGPLSTSKGVRNALLKDWCTWDSDYNEDVVQNIRHRLVKLATNSYENFTTVLMQGSGSFCIEATITTALPKSSKLLVITNGVYGNRIIQMAIVLKIKHIIYSVDEKQVPDCQQVSDILTKNPDITHVALVHCETTTGILNPLEKIAKVVKDNNKILIVDAMSSFGGIVFDVEKLQIDYLVSSSNKCIQGVPGFGFVIARKTELEKTQRNARSLCLDLYDQWKAMDKTGKWRFTSPTHTVRAFLQALVELDIEGGISSRNQRYVENQRILSEGMIDLGFDTLLNDEIQSPIITSFLYPNATFDFNSFYKQIKEKGFVIYPGKISSANTFRIGNIGEVYPKDMIKLLQVINEIKY